MKSSVFKLCHVNKDVLNIIHASTLNASCELHHTRPIMVNINWFNLLIDVSQYDM
jgi:hypothetical protein